MTGSPSPSRRTWAMALVLLLALALRVPGMTASVWFDEACMSSQRVGTWAQLLTTLYVDIHPPLFLSGMHLWGRLFGDGEVMLRLPALAAGLASLPLCFALARRLAGEPTAWVATVLLAVSPVHVYYSHEARLYAPMLALALAAALLFHRAAERAARGESARLWPLALVLLVALGTHYYLATYVLVLLLAGLLLWRTDAVGELPRLGRRLALWTGGLLALTAAWVVIKLRLAEFETSQGYMESFDLAELGRLLFSWSWTGEVLPGASMGAVGAPAQAALVALGVALFALGALALWRDRDRRPGGPFLLVWLLAIPVFLLVIAWLGLEGTYIERSALPALGFLVIVVARGAVEAWGWRGPAGRGLGALLVLLVALNLTAFFRWGDEWLLYKPHQDWRGVARHLDAELEAGAAHRPVLATMPNCRTLPYYDARIQDAKNLAPTPGKLEGARRAFVGLLGEGLGGSLADYADGIAGDYEATKAELLADAELLLLQPPASPRLGPADLDAWLRALDAERTAAGAPPRPDGVVYLLQNRYHPPGDKRLLRLGEALGERVLERVDLTGLTLFKVQGPEPTP